MNRVLPLLLFWVACENVIDIDPPDYSPEVTALSFFNTYSEWTVRVSQTVPIDQTGTIDSPYLENANVSIWQGDQLLERFNNTLSGNGIYESVGGLTPKPNTEYRLTVEVPGLGRAEARSIMPEAPELLNMGLKSLSASGRDSTFLVRFRLKDGPGADFYSFKAFYGYAWADVEDGPEVVEELYLERNDPTWHCQYDSAMNPVLNEFDTGGTEWCQLGIMTDRQFAGKERDFEFTVTPFTPRGPQKPIIVLMVNSVSEPYFEYHRSLEIYDGSDPFSEPAQIYTNLEGGRGVFAGFSTTFRILELPTD